MTDDICLEPQPPSAAANRLRTRRAARSTGISQSRKDCSISFLKIPSSDRGIGSVAFPQRDDNALLVVICVEHPDRLFRCCAFASSGDAATLARFGCGLKAQCRVRNAQDVFLL